MPEFSPNEATVLLKSAVKERLAKFELEFAELKAKELAKSVKICKGCEPLMKPPVSEAQRGAMGAAAGGNSTLGIPKSVGQDYMEADKGGKLPVHKGEPPMAKPPSGKGPPVGTTVPTSKTEEMTKAAPGSFANQARQHMMSDASRQASVQPQPKLPTPQENEVRAAAYANAMPQPQSQIKPPSPVMKRRIAPKANVSAGPVQSAARPAPAKVGIFGVLSRRITGR